MWVVPGKREDFQGSGYLLPGREIFQHFNDQEGPIGACQAESAPHSVRLLLSGGMRWELPKAIGIKVFLRYIGIAMNLIFLFQLLLSDGRNQSLLLWPCLALHLCLSDMRSKWSRFYLPVEQWAHSYFHMLPKCNSDHVLFLKSFTLFLLPTG